MRRRGLVSVLQACGRLPLCHATTISAQQAAVLFGQHALVLNVPLNHELNHRVFEVMAAGVPQLLLLYAEPVAARKDDAPAALQADMANLAGLGSSTGGGGLIQTTSG